MQASTYEFLSIRAVCRPTDDPQELVASDNRIVTVLKGEETVYQAPEFFHDDDDLLAVDLASANRIDMTRWSLRSDDTLVATLKDAVLEKFSRTPVVTNTFNLFVGENVALSEAYHNLAFSERLTDLLGETATLEFPGGTVRAKIRESGGAPVRIEQPGFCLASRFTHHNYYHWMIEALPRLQFLTMLPDHQNIPLIFPAPGLKPFHQASLQALGIRNPVIAVNTRLAMFTKLYFTTFLDPGAVTKRQVDWLRARLFPAASEAGQADRPRRLYISRRDTNARNVVNEAEVMQFLAPLGFEVVVPGTLSLEQQVRTFASAEMIVATHGAGNTNSVFCRPGSVMIELVPDSVRQPHYWMLSSVAGLRYGRVICNDHHPTGSMTVDIGKLRTVLDRAGIR
ncbi:glycosyltransferase family 61 protein [Azospirillum sp.]|uniref:glycosyltransferase family 61 protein n=1 Tax=Azospirillum sp. TaxID=34012 RepID=UPI002617F4D7|nr:glycosyltransferase family 61 protein [Azospirillum sp.]